jgi:hypothetical protein
MYAVRRFSDEEDGQNIISQERDVPGSGAEAKTAASGQKTGQVEKTEFLFYACVLVFLFSLLNSSGFGGIGYKIGEPDAGDSLAGLQIDQLHGEDAGAGKPAEDAEIEHKQELVDNSDAGHRLRTDLADHDIIQKAYKICDHILHQSGQHDGKKPPIKGPAADKSTQAHARFPQDKMSNLRQYTGRIRKKQAAKKF